VATSEGRSWVDIAARLKFEQKVSWGRLSDELYVATGQRLSLNCIRAALRHRPEYGEAQSHPRQADAKSTILHAAAKGTTAAALCKSTGLTARMLAATLADLRDEGYQLIEYDGEIRLSRTAPPAENVFDLDWNGDRVLRFGVVSDTHLGSRWQQISHLNRMYDVFAREGLTRVYHNGDLTEGVRMRPGHEHEVFLHGADEQSDYVIDAYPHRDGLETWFITGNHDHSSIKHAGHDIGRSIALRRPDMKYLGLSNAQINLTPNCVLELNHPLDGSAYALSYATQKTIDAMTGGEKPHILLSGHHHKYFTMFYRNIHTIEAGCFQSQTAWMRGKRLPADVGGIIVEVHVADDGTINRCRVEWCPVFVPVKNDYPRMGAVA
jgi:predicted phosphodiesterase